MFAIVQNDPEVPAGSIIELSRRAGGAHAVIPAYAGAPLPEPELLTAVIVLGGAMGVHQVERFPYLGYVQRFMAQTLRLSVPLFGICLGGQLLAQLLGGSVTPSSPHGEKGVQRVSLTPQGSADPLFAGVPAEFTTFQWHEDSFLPPAHAVLLASSPVCPWQAFRCGDHAYGVQFHPEVDRRIVADWSSCTGEGGRYLASFDAAAAELTAHCHAIIANFIALAIDSRRP